MLFLAVLRTSRHPQKCIPAKQGKAISVCLWIQRSVLFPSLLNTSIASFVYRRKCLNAKKSKCIYVYRHYGLKMVNSYLELHGGSPGDMTIKPFSEVVVGKVDVITFQARMPK